MHVPQAAAARRFVSDRLDHFLLPNKTGGMVLDGTISPATDTGDCGDNWVFGINYLDRHIRMPGAGPAAAAAAGSPHAHDAESDARDLELAMLLGE